MKEKSVILVDIGNTSAQVALARGGHFVVVKRIGTSRQTRKLARNVLDSIARRVKVDGAILCSVVPRLDRAWLGELKRLAQGPVLQVSHKLELGIKIRYPRPETIGADRLANAVAAAERYGAPVIVADLGTGLTVDAVSAKCEYLGGIIAPGPMLFADYLAERTALLPRLSLASIQKRSKAALGKSTREAMLIGLRAGYSGMLKEFIRRLKLERGLQNARVCATGGFAETILAGTDLKIGLDPLLTLRGIGRIYRLNV